MKTAKGIIIAAPSSGSGKTLVTLGLVRAMRNQGLRVAVFKTGPDYIDPGFLSAASGSECFNLDPWAMRSETIASFVMQAKKANDIIIVEGVMGLFDGAGGGGGSTADLAAHLGLPVVLVIDAARQAQSAGAVVRGFSAHRADISVVGVICNRVASPRHEKLLAEGISNVGIPVLGSIPRLPELKLDSRHLGLVQARERAGLDRLIGAAAAAVDANVDLTALAALAQLPSVKTVAPGQIGRPPLGQHIAVAYDTAFGFAYPHLLEGWRSQGAVITPFSPLANDPPPPFADAIFLPGGYPELHAERIAANAVFLDGLRARAAAGTQIYGECGGYMVLGEGLIDAEGRRHQMAGLLKLETSFASPSLTLGYRQAVLTAPSPLGGIGARFRGHEFHYATQVRAEGRPLVGLEDAEGASLGTAGLVVGTVAGSFFHLIDSC